jgi:hypothetical protein
MPMKSASRARLASGSARRSSYRRLVRAVSGTWVSAATPVQIIGDQRSRPNTSTGIGKSLSLRAS